MTRVNVHVAQSRLSELLDRVQRGEEVIITRSGKPAAKLVPRPQPQRNYRSIVGCWNGKVDLSRFNEADEEIAREFGVLD